MIFVSCLEQLPNRLGKMLAPLHWHDYKKKYGKLDDFVAGHPEVHLFLLMCFSILTFNFLDRIWQFANIFSLWVTLVIFH